MVWPISGSTCSRPLIRKREFGTRPAPQVHCAAQLLLRRCMNQPLLRNHQVHNPREVWNGRDYGLAGNGEVNDQPALAALVEELGREYSKDGRPRIVYCPPGTYRIAG